MKLLRLVRAAVLAASALLLVVSASGAADTKATTLDHDAHLVTNLPGLDPAAATFKHYAGHLELATREKLFYWYTESQESPETAPIVLWLNGGPGCSSLGGFFTENGPFVVNADLSVRLNRHAWNRKANVVWLESPAGVGFSGPVQDASYYNDDVVAAKAREFLGRFFATYPELQGRKFYITGESYAGMYIPYLVDLLVREPLEHVAFAGFAIGNAYTDNQIDNSAYVDYLYSHGMISLESFREIQTECGRTGMGCVFADELCSDVCKQLLDASVDAAQEDKFNPYFIYGDVCLLSNSQAAALLSKPHNVNVTALQAQRQQRNDIGPCADTFTLEYLNQLDVQLAIHAVPSGGDGQDASLLPVSTVNWVDCSDEVGALFTSSASSLPKYPGILNKGLDILIYSGDADSNTNFIGTQRWIGEDGLKLHVTDKWKAWFGPDSQLAGYVQGYDGLTFKTVKGAGHMVPAVKPLHALYMIECFVFGDAACATFTYPVDLEEIEAGEVQTLSAASSLSSSEWVVATVALCASAGALIAAIRFKKTAKRSNYEPIASTA